MVLMSKANFDHLCDSAGGFILVLAIILVLYIIGLVSNWNTENRKWWLMWLCAIIPIYAFDIWFIFYGGG